jgi:hypothetical protein
LSTVGARPLLWIHRVDSKFLLQQCCCGVDVATAIFNLLDSFAKFLKVACDRSGALGVAARENVEGYIAREMKLKLARVLVRGYCGELGRAVRAVDGFKCDWSYREADGGPWPSRCEPFQEFPKGRIDPPFARSRFGQFTASSKDVSSAGRPFGRVRRTQHRDGCCKRAGHIAEQIVA